MKIVKNDSLNHSANKVLVSRQIEKSVEELENELDLIQKETIEKRFEFIVSDGCLNFFKDVLKMGNFESSRSAIQIITIAKGIIEDKSKGNYELSYAELIKGIDNLPNKFTLQAESLNALYGYLISFKGYGILQAAVYLDFLSMVSDKQIELQEDYKKIYEKNIELGAKSMGVSVSEYVEQIKKDGIV